jgi:hypothetical protein
VDGLHGIAYGDDRNDAGASQIELLAHPGGIGVNHLADEDFIAYSKE